MTGRYRERAKLPLAQPHAKLLAFLMVYFSAPAIGRFCGVSEKTVLRAIKGGALRAVSRQRISDAMDRLRSI